MNDATCSVSAVDGVDVAACTCTAGFSGARCDVDVDNVDADIDLDAIDFDIDMVSKSTWTSTMKSSMN